MSAGTPTPPVPPVPGETIASQFVAWVICGVGLGILPVIFNFLAPVFTGDQFSLLRPLGDGELLIASTAIAGAALTELLRVSVTGPAARMRANVAGGLGILCCALCAAMYTLIKITNERLQKGQPGSPPFGAFEFQQAVGSTTLFVVTVTCAAVAVKVAAEARR